MTFPMGDPMELNDFRKLSTGDQVKMRDRDSIFMVKEVLSSPSGQRIVQAEHLVAIDRDVSEWVKEDKSPLHSITDLGVGQSLWRKGLPQRYEVTAVYETCAWAIHRVPITESTAQIWERAVPPESP